MTTASLLFRKRNLSPQQSTFRDPTKSFLKALREISLWQPLLSPRTAEPHTPSFLTMSAQVARKLGSVKALATPMELPADTASKRHSAPSVTALRRPRPSVSITSVSPLLAAVMPRRNVTSQVRALIAATGSSKAHEGCPKHATQCHLL